MEQPSITPGAAGEQIQLRKFGRSGLRDSGSEERTERGLLPEAAQGSAVSIAAFSI
jgi:hypothetical protein